MSSAGTTETAFSYLITMSISNLLTRQIPDAFLPTATELQRLEAFFGGGIMSDTALDTIKESDIPAGTSLKLTGDLQGLTIWHLDDAGKKKYLTDQEWRLSCGPAFARKINEENAGKGYDPRSPAFIPLKASGTRPVFQSFEEAIDRAREISGRTSNGPVGKIKIPAYLDSQFRTVVMLITEGKIEHGDEINLIRATLNDSKQLSRSKITVKELVVKRAKKLWGQFDSEDPRRHKQFRPRTNRYFAARTLFELIDFLGHKKVYEITPEDAAAFITYMLKCREEQNRPGQRSLKPNTVINQISYVFAVFELGFKKRFCDENPFEEVYDQLSHVAADYEDDRTENRKPDSVEALQRLLRLAWNHNKLMCLAFLLAILQGLRRCEILAASGECLDPEEGGYVVAAGDMVKKRTQARITPWTPCFREWMAVYPDLSSLMKLIPLSEADYSLLGHKLRFEAGLETDGKDELRKNYTIYTQWSGKYSDVIRAFIQGHTRSVMLAKYNGGGSRRWAKDMETKLGPEAVLGFMPERCSIADLLACIPVKEPRKKRSVLPSA